ncbi:hypothetical protein QQP08_015959 [Theobroma cacao]|nr:hypothetical protein QQP08_015959 [Theobroma cacao]
MSNNHVFYIQRFEVEKHASGTSYLYSEVVIGVETIHHASISLPHCNIPDMQELPLHLAKRTNGTVHNIRVNNLAPTFIRLEAHGSLGNHGVHCDILSYEGTIVRICLLVKLEYVMLRDEMVGHCHIALIPPPTNDESIKYRAESVEKELEDDPYGFCYNSSHKMGFGVAWDIHVHAI